MAKHTTSEFLWFDQGMHKNAQLVAEPQDIHYLKISRNGYLSLFAIHKPWQFARPQRLFYCIQTLLQGTSP